MIIFSVMFVSVTFSCTGLKERRILFTSKSVFPLVSPMFVVAVVVVVVVVVVVL